jgi:hypothetical protein
VTDGLSGEDLALRLGAIQEAQRIGSRTWAPSTC